MERKNKLNFLSLAAFLTAVISFSLFFSVQGSAKEIQREVYNVSSISESGYAPLNFRLNFSDKTSTGSSKSSLPSAYDSREKKVITSVKDQGAHGACWAFAAVSASETSLIKEFEGYNTKNTDLSEVHLSYFAFAEATDPLGLTKGDYSEIKKGNFLDNGGNSYFATFTLARWFGIADEKVAPYKKATSKTKLSKSLAYSKNKALLENCYWVSMEDPDSVKSMIMKYGSCAASYYHDDINLNTDTGAYYQWRNILGNHAITIVGWDDNYSTDNFGGLFGLSFKPKSNGAWLVKNSYGKSVGKDGYLWISYEDKSIVTDCAAFFDFMPSDTYENNYQYDGSCTFSTYYNKNSIYMSNVFQTVGKEKLEAFSFFTSDEDIKCKYQIYRNVKGKTNPRNGKPVYEEFVDCSQDYAGYHTVKLKKAITLNEGERFSVVIKLSQKGEMVHAICDYAGYLDTAKSIYNHTSSKKGQSFISDNGKKWDDLYENKEGENLRIKAFTNSAVVLPKKAVAAEKEISLEKGKTKEIILKVSPSDADKSFKWSSSDKKIATVSSDGKIKGGACGVATITYQSLKNKMVKGSVKVTVVPKKVSGFSQKEETTTSCSVTWKKQSGIKGYIVYIENAEGKKERVAKLNENSYTFKKLKSGKNYKIFVVSYKQIKDENEKKITVKSPYSAFEITAEPGKVSLSLKSAGKITVNLKWKAVRGADKYRIYMFDNKKGEFVSVLTTDKTSCKISSLKKNTEYVFIAKAIAKTPEKNCFSKASEELKVKTKG